MTKSRVTKYDPPVIEEGQPKPGLSKGRPPTLDDPTLTTLDPSSTSESQSRTEEKGTYPGPKSQEEQTSFTRPWSRVSEVLLPDHTKDLVLDTRPSLTPSHRPSPSPPSSSFLPSPPPSPLVSLPLPSSPSSSSFLSVSLYSSRRRPSVLLILYPRVRSQTRQMNLPPCDTEPTRVCHPLGFQLI